MPRGDRDNLESGRAIPETLLIKPSLPSVPTPPSGRPVKRVVEPPAPKPEKRRFEPRVDSEFVESEIRKINFFIANKRKMDARNAYELLLKDLGKRKSYASLRKRYELDLKKLKALIELLEL